MSAIRKTETLFDKTSIHATDYSLRVFSFMDQVTIQATGLHPDDVITFEVLHVESGTMDEACGCFIKDGQMPRIAAVEKLRCFECDPGIVEDGHAEVSQPIRLTASNPIVILNAPQGPLLRAHYSGPGLGTSVVWATIGTDTPLPLVPGMDGCPGTCCVDTDWQENGKQRCNLATDEKERQEVSNCGNERWVVIGPLNWQDTGAERCLDNVAQIQQVNDCGDLRWIDTEVSCGWIPTYELPCGGLAFRPTDLRDPEATVEIDGCGEEGIAYIYPTPRPWATKPISDCKSCADGEDVLGYAYQDGRPACDPCEGDPGAWVPTGERKYTGDYGASQYSVSRQEINGCGHYDWKADGQLPWVDTGEIRCADGRTEREQVTIFGNTRWVDNGEQVWSREGSERCITDGTDFYEVHRKELNQCGELRWVFDRTLRWEDTGEFRCSLVSEINIHVQQTTICGELRWVISTDQVQNWADTGARYCVADMVKRQEQNQCGNIRWVDDALVEWVETGAERCVQDEDPDGMYQVQRQETNQCGQLRWVDGERLAWAPTGVRLCGPGDFISYQEATKCGQLRWVESSLTVDWEQTGISRCTDHVLEHQEVNQCGILRWVPSTESCGYLPTYQLPCGGLAFRDTDIVDPEATVPLNDCEDNPIALIYPTPRQGASTPVSDCQGCLDGGNIIGYATDGGLVSPDCFGPGEPTAVQIFTENGHTKTLWSNGKITG